MPTPGKRSSMRQIAAAAGVSVATVSHVINGSGRFSEDTPQTGCHSTTTARVDTSFRVQAPGSHPT